MLCHASIFGTYEAIKATINSATECERTAPGGIAATATAGCAAVFTNKLFDHFMPSSIGDLHAKEVATNAHTMAGAAKPRLPPLLPTLKTLPFGCLAFVALEYGRDLSDAIDDAL